MRFGNETCAALTIKRAMENGDFERKIPLYESILRQVLNEPVTQDVEIPKPNEAMFKVDREQFVQEVSSASQTNPGLLEPIRVHASVFRIDGRPPEIIAESQGIFGGNPEKPSGSVVEHTVGKKIGIALYDAGTSTYTSVSTKLTPELLTQPIWFPELPNKIIFADGTSKSMNQKDWEALTKSKFPSDLTDFDGAIAVWETHIYRGENVEGTRVLDGKGLAENEIITRGFVPVGVRKAAVYQPITVIEKNGTKQIFKPGIHNNVKETKEIIRIFIGEEKPMSTAN